MEAEFRKVGKALFVELDSETELWIRRSRQSHRYEVIRHSRSSIEKPNWSLIGRYSSLVEAKKAAHRFLPG